MNFSLSQKPKSPGHPEEGKVWIATPQCGEQLNTEEFIKRIANGNPQLKAQLTANFSLISYYVREYLRQGYRLNLGDLGSFYVKFDCKPFEGETPDGYNPHTNIKDVKAAWSPSKALKSLIEPQGNHAIEKISFKKVFSRKLQKLMNDASKNGDKTIQVR